MKEDLRALIEIIEAREQINYSLGRDTPPSIIVEIDGYEITPLIGTTVGILDMLTAIHGELAKAESEYRSKLKNKL